MNAACRFLLLIYCVVLFPKEIAGEVDGALQDPSFPRDAASMAVGAVR